MIPAVVAKMVSILVIVGWPAPQGKKYPTRSFVPIVPSASRPRPVLSRCKRRDNPNRSHFLKTSPVPEPEAESVPQEERKERIRRPPGTEGKRVNEQRQVAQEVHGENKDGGTVRGEPAKSRYGNSMQSPFRRTNVIVENFSSSPLSLFLSVFPFSFRR